MTTTKQTQTLILLHCDAPGCHGSAITSLAIGTDDGAPVPPIVLPGWWRITRNGEVEHSLDVAQDACSEECMRRVTSRRRV